MGRLCIGIWITRVSEGLGGGKMGRLCIGIWITGVSEGLVEVRLPSNFMRDSPEYLQPSVASHGLDIRLRCVGKYALSRPPLRRSSMSS
jgi:hypothetical protein